MIWRGWGRPTRGSGGAGPTSDPPTPFPWTIENSSDSLAPRATKFWENPAPNRYEAATRVIPVVSEIPGLEAPLNGRGDVLFVGGFAHSPNVDAIAHFAASCWPLVRARLPRARLLVVGSNAPPSVLALAELIPRRESTCSVMLRILAR